MNTDTPKEAILAAAQFARAYRLARSYGHLWATCWPEGDVDRPVSVEEIRANTLIVDAESTWQGFCLLAPDTRVIEVGNESLVEVVHTTVSGRLEWVVNELGGVTLTVRRPGKMQRVDVLAAYVDSDNNVAEVVQMDAYLTTQKRHVESLGEALDKLGVTEGFLALVGVHETEESDYDRTPVPLADVLARLRIAPTCTECVVVRVYDDGTVALTDLNPCAMDTEMTEFGGFDRRRRMWREDGTTVTDTLHRAVA